MKNGNVDFKHYLRSELIRRSQKNPKYSMRSFAKNLGMDGSTLSKILNGKRLLGKKAMHALGIKLGLKESEIKKFINTAKGVQPDIDYEIIQDDLFSFISDWYYYGILELFRVETFDPSAQSIAKALRITVHEARDAIERLQRLGMIKVENGRWVDATSGRSTNISNQATSVARRTQQKQILSKAISAVDEISPEKRSNTSMTFAVDTSKLADANETIKKFRRDMGNLLSRGDRRNEVYNLAIALYPISEIEKK